MRNDKFVRTLHRRTILKELSRLLMDKYVVTNSTTKQSLLCEDAPYNDRFVSQEAFGDIVGLLSALEEQENKNLLRFEIREKDPPQLPTQQKEEDDRQEEESPGPPRRRRRGGAPPSAPPANR